MEQILAMQLMCELSREPAHGRELAKRLNINHMTVARSLAALVKQNALDFTMQGRNKVYRLKQTIEAKGLLAMAELNRLNESVRCYPRLRKICDALQNQPKVGLAIVFGSYAKGTARSDSDIDLYIDTDDRKLRDEIAGFDPKLSVKIGAFNLESPLIREIVRNHIIIKGFDIYYEKVRGTGAAKR